MDRLEHQGSLAQLAGRHVAEDVAIEVNHAALPAHVGEELGSAMDQTHAGVGDDQFDTLQTVLREMTQEGAPTGLVLLRALDNAKNLPVPSALTEIATSSETLAPHRPRRV